MFVQPRSSRFSISWEWVHVLRLLQFYDSPWCSQKLDSMESIRRSNHHRWLSPVFTSIQPAFSMIKLWVGLCDTKPFMGVVKPTFLHLSISIAFNSYLISSNKWQMALFKSFVRSTGVLLVWTIRSQICRALREGKRHKSWRWIDMRISSLLLNDVCIRLMGVNLVVRYGFIENYRCLYA